MAQEDLENYLILSSKTQDLDQIILKGLSKPHRRDP